ncbi:MAG: hypothetical protein ACTSU2_10130 [Promethearchaeota archaeon]
MSKSDDTLCIFTKIKDSIPLNKEIRDLISKKGENIFLIIPNPNNIKKIIMFPTKAHSGIYTKINLDKEYRLDDKFFMELRRILANFKLKTLFTTGICLELENCYWEGIFEYNEDFPIDEFKKSLQEIESVLNIKMKILKENE